MTEIRTHMDRNGKILIPLSLRKELGFDYGDSFVLRVINGELRVVNLKQVVSDVQKIFARFKNDDDKTSLVDEFIQTRRVEAQKEDDKYAR